MEALGAASAVIGIAGFGLQVYQTLSVFITKVTGAHKCITALQIDINLTYIALDELQKVLVRDAKETPDEAIFGATVLSAMKNAADQCMLIFQDVISYIESVGGKLKISISTKEIPSKTEYKIPEFDEIFVSRWKSVKWALVQDDVAVFTSRLSTFKLTLNLLVSVTSFRVKYSDPSTRTRLKEEATIDNNVILDIQAQLRAANLRWDKLEEHLKERQSKQFTTAEDPRRSDDISFSKSVAGEQQNGIQTLGSKIVASPTANKGVEIPSSTVEGKDPPPQEMDEASTKPTATRTPSSYFDTYIYEFGETSGMPLSQTAATEKDASLSKSDFWTLFTSLSSSERAGVQLALKRPRSGYARSLSSLHVLRTSGRGANFLRIMLRILSLGVLDHRSTSSRTGRTLLIIVLNSILDGTQVRPTSPRVTRLPNESGESLENDMSFGSSADESPMPPLPLRPIEPGPRQLLSPPPPQPEPIIIVDRSQRAPLQQDGRVHSLPARIGEVVEVRQDKVKASSPVRGEEEPQWRAEIDIEEDSDEQPVNKVVENLFGDWKPDFL